MGNYLVTGAAGFIGSAIAKKLVEENNNVVTIDNFSTGFKRNVPEKVETIEGNDFDETVLNKLNGRNFDAIIHIAGQSSGEISFEKPVYDLQTNAQSTLMLLNYARKTGCKNFIFASSMSVYGDHKEKQVDENSSAVPKSFYAVGKLASENYMRIFSQEYGLKCTALRFFNVYGIGQNMENLKQGMASIYLAQAIKSKHIIIKGTGERFRDFVYISDVVEAVRKSLEREAGNDFEIYNVSTNKPTLVKDIIKLIVDNVNFDLTYEYVDGTPGDQFGIYGNNEKIKKDLGWFPTFTFEDGMKKMIDWAVNNPF
ncbi:NAD-dependent epimerase/dehydratase family protein [Treponema sp.]|uniref:NAD-dependent epimerase/dehydratase family protein n=1 Tax=Treponema sp. TaxID=166 RepID=UPI003EFC9C9C